MDTQEHIDIRPHHRARLAVVYVRTTTIPDSPADYTRLKAQRDQAQHARVWGWPESAIQVIEDLGRSGASGAERPGWQRLLDLVQQGQVGIVLVSDLSRLSRCSDDLAAVLRLCQQADTLLAIDRSLMRRATVYFRESSPGQGAAQAGSVAPQRRHAEAHNNGGLNTTGQA